MKTQSKPFVVAIAAVSGGGKTTVTKRLSETLEQSKALYFDDYEFEGEPEDICEWVENGGSSNDWDLSPLIRDVEILVSEDNPPLDYIILDYPFAYTHQGMSPYIDYAVFIDTPLDIALARRILRDYKDDSIENVRNDMMFYLARSRLAYLHMLRTIKPDSDLVVDGSLAIKNIVDRIKEELNTRISLG